MIPNSHEQALELIAAEVARQDRMWGASNERADSSANQLHDAAIAQLVALGCKQQQDDGAFSKDGVGFTFYPNDWSGFRDYGSDIANLVVAAAYIHQEIKRKVAAGEDATRLSRDAATQPYAAETIPASIEA